MSRPGLLEAVDAALGRLTEPAEGGFSPPFATAGEAVAKDNSLSEQGIRHFCHFRHPESNEPVGLPSSSRSSQHEDGDVDNDGELAALTFLLEESCGESGENHKSAAVPMGYLSPHRPGHVVKGGKSGKSEAAPDRPGLLATVGAREAAGALAREVSPAGRRDRIERWLTDHPPPPSDPHRCAQCDAPIDAWGTGTLAVLRTLEPPDAVWLHVACHAPWHRARLAQAWAATADTEASS